MKVIETNIAVEHMALIEIFFKANRLENVKIGDCIKIYNGNPHHYIEISWDETSETGVQISYMSVVHMGFLNMLDDFLLKCGVDINNFEPTSLKQQKRREK